MKEKWIQDAIYASLLKPFIHDPFNKDPELEPAVRISDRHIVYGVEKLLEYCIRNRKILYLVKWKGYLDHENTRNDRKT